MIKSSTKLLSKNKSQEDMLLAQKERQEMKKYDTNKIFEEFKKHMFKQDKKQKNKNFTMENSYKDLLCSVRKNNAEKKQKLSKITNRYQIIKIDSVTLRSKSSYKLSNNFQTHRQDVKRQKTEQFIESRVNPVESYCKFKPIRPMTTDNKFRLGSGSRSRLLENRTPSRLTSQVSRVLSPKTSFCNLELSQFKKTQTTIIQHSAQKSLPEISQSIMMVQQQQIKLQQEISSLSQSMNKFTKELATLKKQLQTHERNQKKYKHISNLTTSIKNQTEYIKQQNHKGLTAMISRQDKTISHLKKFKMSLRKEKDEIESDYIEGINKFLKLQEEKHANWQKQMLFMATYMPNEKINKQNSLKQIVDLIVEEKAHKQKGLKFELIKKYNTTNQRKLQSHQSPRNVIANTRLIKKLVDELDSIIELFQQKQPSFEAIKQQQCTRVRLGKIKKQLLPKPRVQILQKIEQFEQKYEMKIASVSNLMMRIYHMLTDENERLEADCLKLTQSKEEGNVELKKIMQKHGTELESHFKEDKLLAQELLRQKKMNSMIKQNSWVFLKIIQGLYNILLKYRHMFSLALTLDVEKSQFKETVIQIDSLFSEGLLAGFGTQKALSSGNERHIVINQHWFRESLKEKEIQEPFIRQLIDMMFNDHRVGLMIKKIWIQSYLALIYQSMEGKETQVLHIIETIHNDCSQMYQRKLPTISSLFLKCFKSLHMTKYQSKLAASSRQSGQIFLLNRPVKKLFDPEFIMDRQQSLQYEDSRQNSKKKITDVSETSTTQEDVLEKNPMKVIFNLEAIKNKSHKKFKALNFSCSGKAYKYNEEIIIPNFHMIAKSEDI